MGLLYLEAVAECMPDLILELCPLVAVERDWAPKQSKSAGNQLVSDHLPFLTWNGVSPIILTEPVLCSQDEPVPL